MLEWFGELCGFGGEKLLARDRDLDQRGRPAALKPAAAVARIVVRGDVQHVVAGFAEGRHRRRFAAERGSAAGQLLDRWIRLVEGYLSRSPELRPQEPDRRRRIPQRRIIPAMLRAVYAPRLKPKM